MQDNRITIQAQIGGPINRVWQAFSNPEDITKWNFASHSWCCPHAEVDLTIGGTYKARMEAKDGSSGFDFIAQYTLIEPPHAVTMVLGDGRISATRFVARDGGTLVQTTFEPETVNPLDMQRDGWQAILNNFKNYLETEASTG